MRVVSLFGHHRAAAPTVFSRLGDLGSALVHLPLAVWLTVIPIAGGIGIAVVTHWLNLSRDRLTLKREEERQRGDDARSALRVRADLAFRLVRHREALRAAARGGDVVRLEHEHAALLQRATESDVIDALGNRYLPFMAVLQREEAALHADDRTNALATLETSFEPYLELFSLPHAASR